MVVSVLLGSLFTLILPLAYCCTQTQNLATELVQKLPAVALTYLMSLNQVAPAMAADTFTPPVAVETAAPASQVTGLHVAHAFVVPGARTSGHSA